MVAVDATGTIAGLATAGTSRDPDAPTILELYSINVVQHLQGRGLADALMDATVDRCDLTVWVVAENARARRFYDRHGFRVDAGTRLHEGTGASEMRMVRRFQAADR